MHMVRLARDVGPAGARAGAARLPRPVPLRRRDGAPAGRHAVGRREGAPGAGDARLAAPQPAAARRADQPPRPDDARGAVDGAQRVRRHGDAGQPRPRAAARGVRRVLAGRRRRRRSRSTATSTTTSAGCSSRRAPRARRGRPARPDGASAARRSARRHRRRRPRCALAPRAAAATPPAKARRADRKAAAAARQQRADAAKPLKKELNLVDNRSASCSPSATRSRRRCADDALDAEQRADTGRRLKTIGAQIEALEARWLALSTQLDDIAESVG